MTETGPEEASRRPTLKTIAQISGLAVTTVSRALGDAPDISQETKKRVRKIAREIGYVPNRAGVRLRTGRTNVISLVLETEDDAMNMTSRLIASIAAGLGGTPFHLVMMPELPGQDPLKSVRYIVETRSADAVIINRIQPEDPRVAYLRERRFPFVTHGRTIWARDHSWFDFDNEAFGRIAVETLAARGRREILMLAPPTDQAYARDMIDGARLAAARRGVAFDVIGGVSSDDGRAAVSEVMARVLAGRPATDALISASPNATMVATPVVEAAGRTLGADFDLYSKETVPFLTLFRPGILTMSEDVAKAGRFLAEAAMQEVASGGLSHRQYLDGPDMGAPAPRLGA